MARLVDKNKLMKLMIQNKNNLTLVEFCKEYNYTEATVSNFLYKNKMKRKTYFKVNGGNRTGMDFKIVNAFMETGNFADTVKLMKERYNYVLKQPEFEKVEKEYLL